MPLTALRTATSPNVAYTRLLYTVSGSEQATNPQFQYVCDVYNRDTNELLKRMTQPINPAGTATFDIARIVQGELKPDYNWKINTPTEFSSSKQGFEVKLGQQYATSISSSVTVYPNLANYQIYCNQGVIEPNAGAYNWLQVVDSNTLSNMPATMSMQADDYGTISAYVSSGSTVISQSFYNIYGTLIDTKNYSLTSGFDDYFWAIPISSSNPYWNYADVSISGSYDLKTFRYEVSNETHREKVRFAFVNKLGAWDYYNNYNPVRQTIDVSREQYTAPRVDYSSRVNNYDISRRGRTDYHNNTDDSFTTQTDYLNQTDANWLEELIESPSVYIQRNGEFIPIVITDSSYTANTNENRQKLFQYTINFRPANQPFGTWIPEYVDCPGPPPPFDPTLDGEITPYLWWDFTDSGSMVFQTTGSYTDPSSIYSVTSKGTNTGSLHRPANQADGSAFRWKPPTWEGEYSKFYGEYTVAPGNDNSQLWTYPHNSYSPPFPYTPDDIVLFISSSDFTMIHILKALEEGIGTNVLGMNFDNVSPLVYGAAFEYLNSAGTGSSTQYLSSVESNISASQFRVNDGTATLLTTAYSYSGSTRPWEANVLQVRPETGSYSNFGFAGRGTEATASIDTKPNFSYSGDTNYIDVGYPNRGNDFIISQLLYYSGSLTTSQIDRVVNSFKFSVSYGSEINSINN